MYDDVVRVHVVCGSPETQVISHEFWADEWLLSLQDNGRTLKIIGSGGGTEAKARRDAALAAGLTMFQHHEEE